VKILQRNRRRPACDYGREQSNRRWDG